MPANPLHDGLRLEPTPGPTTLVVFGASGDLTRRKLLSALYQLSRGHRLPARFAVLGVACSVFDDEAFRTQFRQSLLELAGVDAGRYEMATSLVNRLYYLTGELEDPELYTRLAGRNLAGDVVLQLKTAYQDGTTHIVMSPLEFMQRLAIESPS